MNSIKAEARAYAEEITRKIRNLRDGEELTIELERLDYQYGFAKPTRYLLKATRKGPPNVSVLVDYWSDTCGFVTHMPLIEYASENELRKLIETGRRNHLKSFLMKSRIDSRNHAIVSAWWTGKRS